MVGGLISKGALASIPPISNVIAPFLFGHGTWTSMVILPIPSVVGKGESEINWTDGKLVKVTELWGNLGGNPVPVIEIVSAAKASDIDKVMAALGTK